MNVSTVERIYELWDGIRDALEREVEAFNQSHRLDKHREARLCGDKGTLRAEVIWRNTLAEGAKLPKAIVTLDRANSLIHAAYENASVKPVDLRLDLDNGTATLKGPDGIPFENMDAVAKCLLGEFLKELRPPMG
jgi:hypothetical protein